MNHFIIIVITVAKCALFILYSFLVGPVLVLEQQLTSCFRQAAEERPQMPSLNCINPA